MIETAGGLWTVAEVLIASLLFAFIWYAKNHFDVETPESFDKMKLAATLAAGLVVGMAMLWAGDPLHQADFFERMTAYAGAIVLLQGVGQAIWRWYLTMDGVHTGKLHDDVDGGEAGTAREPLPYDDPDAEEHPVK